MMSLAVEYAEPAAHLVAWGCGILIQSTLLISVGLAACASLRHCSAALRSSVLRATLLAVLACPLITSVGGLGMVDVPIPHRAAVVSESTRLLMSSPVIAERCLSTGRVETRPSAETRAVAPTTPQVLPWRRRVSLPSLYFALAVCWVSGAALLLVRLSHRHLQAQSLRSGARPAPEHVVEACREMAKRMGFKAPRVMVSPAVGSPFLMGILRPTILLPEARPSLANAHVFAHELAHLRRRDCLWSTLCRLIAALCFFQPLMWKLAGHMDQANEEACDDFVLSYVGERRAYVCRLIDMAETLGYCTSERMGIGVVNLRSSLGRRVQRILSSGTSHTVQTGHSQRLFVAMLGGLAVFFVSFLGAHAAVSVEERDSFADGAVEPDVLPLVTVLTSGEWRKREQAAIALAQMAGAKTAAIPALIEALTDEEWRVRKAAAVALTTTGPAGKGAVSALITALHDEEWHVRRPAAEALAAIGPASEPAVPALSRALSDEEWHVRRAAATALTAIGPEAATAIPTLIERLDDPEWRVRRAAAGALERIAVGDKTAIPEIIDALLDTEWKQRQAAAQSLEKLLQE